MLKQGLVVITVFFISLGVAFAAPPIEMGKKADPRKVIVTVNGVSFYEPDLFGEMNSLLPKMKLHRNISDRKFVEIFNKALDNLVKGALVYEDAKAQGVTIKKKEIDEEIKEIRKSLKKGSLEKTLEENKWTMEQFRAQLEKERLLKKYYKEKSDRIKKEADKLVNETFMREYYDGNKEKFVLPGRVRVREIFFKADSSGGPSHWGEIHAKASAVLKQINEGADFAEMAKEHSEDEYAQKGGDMGLAHLGSFDRAIDAALRKLEVGGVAGPVMSLYGYHLLKLEEKAPSVQRTYDEIKEKLVEELQVKEQKRLWDEWLAGLKKNATVVYSKEVREISGK